MAYPLNVSVDKKQKKFDIDLCLICQEKNKSPLVCKPKPESLNKIREASISRKDHILGTVDELKSEILVFKWHRNCYASYISSHNISRRVKQDVLEQNQEFYEEGSISTCSNSSLLTRSVVPKCDYKKCIFCQQDTKKKIKTTYRISEVDRAKRLLRLCRERQDEIFVRLSTLNDTNDVFAADILYHKLCLDAYFEKSKVIPKSEQPTLDEITQRNVSSSSETYLPSTIDTAFAQLILEIDEDLKTNCFELSNLTNRLKQLCNAVNIKIDNRLVKKLLITHYGDELMFSQPKNQSKSPIVFKASTKPTDLVESIRDIYEKSLNPDTLKEDLKSKAFNMKGYVCNNALISEEFENFKLTSQWELFFKKLIGSERYSNADIKRKCSSIYMDLFYLVTDGDLTPKHVSLAQYIHHYTRSKLLITTLNKLGHCISYSSLKKIDSQAAIDMMTKNNTDTVPLPSNIINNPSLFLHGAVDNDDFAEETLDGKKTTHVTAMVLYQTATESYNFESQIERTPVPKDEQFKSNELIPCQTIKKCLGIKQKPEYYPEPVEIGTSTEERYSLVNNVSDLIWIICRMDHSSDDINSTLPSYALCPGWTPFNQIISKSTMATTNIGFCTLLPAPPTTTDAVYTVMRNFMSINKYVGRQYAVLSCDMAIYLVAKLIQMQKTEFDTLFLRIGAFHLAKNWLGVIGQFVNDSGFSDIFIETELYGENTLKAILKGVHYNRGVRAHKLMYEACRRLQMKVFLKESDDSSTSQLKSHLKNLQETLMSSEDDVAAIYDMIEHDGTNLFSEFNKFLQKKSAENETFKYWCNYCEMVELLLDCIRAERDGNWYLHLRTVTKMIPYLMLYNHVNYVRGCVLYLSDMVKLPPELNTAFKQGHFSVKRKAGKFNNVATDHALEQSLIRSSKIQGGLIGITSNQNAMQNWCLLYHFKTGICQSLQEFCDIYQDPTGDIDEHSHKEWRSNRIERDESDVQLIINFINDHDNPFESSKTELRNIVSGLIASEQASKFLVNVREEGLKRYQLFKKERSIDRVKGLYTPIEKVRVVCMSSQPQEKPKDIKKKDATTNVSSTIMLATQRNADIQTLLKYEILHYPPTLATENGHLKKSVKSELMNIIEIETTCNKTLQDLAGVDNQVHIVDGMSFIHSIPSSVLSNFKTFQDFAEYQLLKIQNLLKNTSTTRVDVVYDSYSNIGSSIKNAELNLRSHGNTPLIVKIHNDLTKIPKQWTRYLASPENKRNLIMYVSHYIINKITIPAGKSVYFSGSLAEESECYMKDQANIISECLSLKSNQTEADTRIFLHAKHALINASCPVNLIIHSPDTDVFVLGISFWEDFKTYDCNSVWLVTGVGDRKRALGCHLASEALGSKISKVLPALHVFTGCDSTSKIGTKKYSFGVLRNSGTSVDVLHLLFENNLTPEQLQKLEAFYLKIIKKKGSSCDESRYINFLSNPSAANDISCLPCTSNSFQQHILRCFAQLYYWRNSLAAFVEPLDLTQYGYFLDDCNNLRPLFMTLPALPDTLIAPCKCKTCAKSSCACFKNKQPCCPYCVCKDKCRNIFLSGNEDETR